ncbi:MAG: hypothetical protein V4676_03090 [Bacteroidota bacterium]
MKKIFAFSLLIVALAACNKDKFQTKPQIKIKSQSGDLIPNVTGAALQVILEFTDKEGDIDDSIIVVRQRLNRRNTAPKRIFGITLPQFNGASQGEIELILNRPNYLPGDLLPIGNAPNAERDTISLKFVLQDRQKNKSDTAETIVYVIR